MGKQCAFDFFVAVRVNPAVYNDSQDNQIRAQNCGGHETRRLEFGNSHVTIEV